MAEERKGGGKKEKERKKIEQWEARADFKPVKRQDKWKQVSNALNA